MLEQIDNSFTISRVLLILLSLAITSFEVALLGSELLPEFSVLVLDSSDASWQGRGRLAFAAEAISRPRDGVSLSRGMSSASSLSAMAARCLGNSTWPLARRQKLEAGLLFVENGALDSARRLQVVCQLDIHLWLVLRGELDATSFLVDKYQDLRSVTRCLLERLHCFGALAADLRGSGLLRLLVKAEELVLVALRIVRSLRHLDDSSLEAEADEVLGGRVVCKLFACWGEWLLRGEEAVVLIVDELFEG